MYVVVEKFEPSMNYFSWGFFPGKLLCVFYVLVVVIWLHSWGSIFVARITVRVLVVFDAVVQKS
jgi:hypothetical protein